MLARAACPSKSFSVWLVVALAAVLAACGKSRRENGSAPSGRGGTSTDAATGGMSGDSDGGGQGGTDAGTAGGGRGGSGAAAAAGGSGAAGRRGGGGAAGRGSSGVGAIGGVAGTAQGGTTQGGAPQDDAGEGGAAGTAGANECAVGAPAQVCNGPIARVLAPIVDFSRYANDGTWTSDTDDGVTGKTTLFHASNAQNLALSAQSGSLHVTGTIPAASSAGWVFEFDQCSNGSQNAGFALTFSGNVGGATLTLAAETNADYPIDASSGKGACAFTSCDSMDSECRPPSAPIPESSLSAGYAYLFWSSFHGGAPNATISDPSFQGLRFEMECTQDTDCVVDLELGRITYDQL